MTLINKIKQVLKELIHLSYLAKNGKNTYGR